MHEPGVMAAVTQGEYTLLTVYQNHFQTCNSLRQAAEQGKSSSGLTDRPVGASSKRHDNGHRKASLSMLSFFFFFLESEKQAFPVTSNEVRWVPIPARYRDPACAKSAASSKCLPALYLSPNRSSVQMEPNGFGSISTLRSYEGP